LLLRLELKIFDFRYGHFSDFVFRISNFLWRIFDL